MEITLYGNPVCPFAHRALITMLEKKLAHKFELIELGDKKPSWFAEKINPAGTIPVLQRGEKMIFESDAICFYADELKEDFPLFPKDPDTRADLRVLMGGYSGMVPLFYKTLRSEDATDTEGLFQSLQKAMTKLDKALAKSGGPYFAGDQFTIADILIVPFFIRFVPLLKVYKDLDILAGMEFLEKWFHACMARETISTTSKPVEFYAEAYKKFLPRTEIPLPSIEDIMPQLRDSSLASPALAINEQANALRAAGKEVYRVGFGESPFPPPKEVMEALSANSHQYPYMPTQGVLELRKAVVGYYERHFGLTHFTPEQIIVIPGAKMCIQHTMAALDCDVVLPSPCWVTYRPDTVIVGRRKFVIQTKREDEWKITPDALAEVLAKPSSRRRLLVLNYPHNPTGVTYTPAELEAIAVVCRKYRVIVLSDEIYSQFLQLGERHTSLAQFYPEGTLVLNGLSKGFGAGGWRLGVCGIPKELMFLMSVFKTLASNSYSLASAPIQFAAAVAFNGSPGIDRYAANTRRIFAPLGKLCHKLMTGGGVLCTTPMSAYYIYIDFEPFRTKMAELGIDNGPACFKQLLEDTGAAILSGVAFEQPASNVTGRFCYVDFDGEKALEAIPEGEGEVSEEFLREYCSGPIIASERIAAWVKKFE